MSGRTEEAGEDPEAERILLLRRRRPAHSYEQRSRPLRAWLRCCGFGRTQLLRPRAGDHPSRLGKACAPHRPPPAGYIEVSHPPAPQGRRCLHCRGPAARSRRSRSSGLLRHARPSARRQPPRAPARRGTAAFGDRYRARRHRHHRPLGHRRQLQPRRPAHVRVRRRGGDRPERQHADARTLPCPARRLSLALSRHRREAHHRYRPHRHRPPQATAAPSRSSSPSARSGAATAISSPASSAISPNGSRPRLAPPLCSRSSVTSAAYRRWARLPR